MYRSAIILAGGSSSRLGEDKGLLELANKPLIRHILNVTEKVVDETLVVVSSEFQVEKFTGVISSKANIVIDGANVHTPLAGMLTGLEAIGGEYALLLPCDTPLISKDVLLLLLELSVNKAAAIPRWPNGYIEPLQAVYHKDPALEAARKALNEEKFELRSMVDNLVGIRYVSTLVLQQLDPTLRTFFNINTPMDLDKAESILKSVNTYSNSFSLLGSFPDLLRKLRGL